MKMGRTYWSAAKALAFLAVLALLYLLLRRIGFAAILEAMRGIEHGKLRLAVGLCLAALIVQSVRVQLLMSPEHRGSFIVMFLIYMAGVFGNVVTPGARVGGEPLRAYYMNKALGGPTTRHFGVLLADKLSNLTVFMAIVLVSVSFVAAFVKLPLASKIVLEVAMLVVILSVVSGFLLHRHFVAQSSRLARLLQGIYNAPLLKFLRRSFPTYGHFEEFAIRKLDNLFGPIGRTASNPAFVGRALGLSVVAWLLQFGANYALFNALGAHVSFFSVVIIISISTFVGDLSMAPGGAGFMETSMIGLCAALGVQQHTAAAVTLVSRGIFYFFALGLGGLCFVALASFYGRRREATGPQEADGQGGNP